MSYLQYRNIQQFKTPAINGKNHLSAPKPINTHKLTGQDEKYAALRLQMARSHGKFH